MLRVFIRLLAAFFLVKLVSTTALEQEKLSEKRHELVQKVPLEVKVPGRAGSRGGAQKLEFMVPTKPQSGLDQVSSATKVHDLALQAWDAVIDGNDVGLQDPKVEAQNQLRSVPLSPDEAWHHWRAAQDGVVDSGRFLITFGVAVSVQSGGSELHIAAAMGETDRCRQLLDDPERPDLEVDMRKEIDGTTPLYSAIATGQLDTVKYLLQEAGANPELHGNNGVRPLMLAAALGHLEIAKEIIRAGADANVQHAFGGTTALHFASEMGHANIIHFLCKEAGADAGLRKTTGGTALHTAADTNQTEAVRALVNSCQVDVHALLAGDTTALYLAAQRGLTNVVETLISELGANPNYEMPRGQNVGSHLAVVDDSDEEASERRRQAQYYDMRNTEIGNGATALHAAAENGHRDTVRALLKLGALQSASMMGATPLVIALQYHHPDIALDLLEAGSDPLLHARVPRDGSWSLLVAADLADKSDENKLVLDRLVHWPGINLNLDNGRGITPLSQAIFRQNGEATVKLLKAGAKVFSSTPSSMHVACQVGFRDKEALDLLVDTAMAELPIQEWSAGQDAHPFHAAAAHGHSDLLENMLKIAGPSLINLRVPSSGATPLMMACQGGNIETVKLLMKYGANVNMKAANSMHGATALYLATASGHAHVVKLLITEGGADATQVLDNYGTSPLHVALEKKNSAVVDVLIRNCPNMDLNLRNEAGLPPLALAILSDDARLVSKMIEAGANLSMTAPVRDMPEASMIQFALHQGRNVGSRVIEALLKHPLAAGKSPLESYELCIMEILRIQTSPRRHRPISEAEKILRILLYSGPDDMKIPEYAFYILANIYEENPSKSDLHGDKLARAIIESKTWQGLTAAERAVYLSYTTELSGFVSPLQVAVKNTRAKLVSRLLEAAPTPEFANQMLYRDVSPNKIGSAIIMAQSNRDFRMIKIMQKFDLGNPYSSAREEL